MANTPSARQSRILEYINQHLEEKGYPPTVREIGEAVGLRSSSTTHGHLKSLEEGGYIEREAALTRAIRLPAVEADPIARGRRFYEAGEPLTPWDRLELWQQQDYIDRACRYDGRPLVGQLEAAA